MREDEHSPLVSICLKCFNQEAYIGDALAGAFAQTYRPLEIVISDDCSTDRSWEIITGAVEEYRRRPDAADVVVSRNERNLGNLGNWLALCSHASGRLLVKADGDDVSLPERAGRIVEAWRADGCRAMVISHGGVQIGPRGQTLGPMAPFSAAAPVGAAMAFDRRVFEAFGGVQDPRIVDDELFAFRARMLGPELVMPDRLVLYRLGTGVSNSLWRIRRPLVKCAQDLLKALDQVRTDIAGADWMRDGEREMWLGRVAEREREFKARLALMEGRTFRERREAARQLAPLPPVSIMNFIQCAFLMPRPAGDAMLLCYALVRHVTRRLRRCG